MLLDKLQGKDRLMVLAEIFTGLRLGGILNLCWQDIDFNKRLITFSHKTGKLVSIPLSDYLSEELCYDIKKAIKVAEYLKPKKSQEMLLTGIANISVNFLRVIYNIYNCTFHALRHTFSSILQGELGIGAVVVARNDRSFKSEYASEGIHIQD